MLSPPVEGFDLRENISQLFGYDYKYYMREYGIPGHNGIDFVVPTNRSGFGEPILAMHNGTVTKITYDTPHKTKGNGIYILDESGKFYTNYWHLSSFEVVISEKVKAGDCIGLMGNSGTVSPEPRPDNPHLGTHLHSGLYIPTINNMYGGFVNPLPFLDLFHNKFPNRFNLNRDIWWRYSGDDVAFLQNILALETEGKTLDYERYGIYGNKTNRDTKEMQLKNDISPVLGYVGNKTKSFIRNKYIDL